MQISFHKLAGVPALDLAYFWRLQIDGTTVVPADHLIPELYYDFLYVQQGQLALSATDSEPLQQLPAQSLRTLHSRSHKLHYQLPLVLYGARFYLRLAENIAPGRPAGHFLPLNWLTTPVNSLPDFASQLQPVLQANRQPRLAGPMFSSGLNESAWLATYSPRQRRRLYQTIFGLSRQGLLAIENLHRFLGQSCNFGDENPRLIKYVDDQAYYDQPHLNRAFKKMTGFTPLAYFEASTILQDNLMAASYNATG
jgi:AraC-like DNA-binding protein